MTTANKARLTSEAPEPAKYKEVKVVYIEAKPDTTATTQPSVEYRWVEVRTARPLGQVSVTVSPADEARKRSNRFFNRHSDG